MYSKFVVFYTLVFYLKSALSGVNIDNGLNLRNTQQMYLNNQNKQNGQNTNRPLDLSRAARNNHQEEILREQHQNIKVPSVNPLFRQPIMTSTRNDNEFKNNIVHPQQNNLKREDNGQSNHPENFNVIPVRPTVEHKNIVRSTTGLFENKNRKILMPSTIQPVSRVPDIDVNNALLNKLTPQRNNIQRSVTNDAFDRQKPMINHQNVYSHQENIQPHRTLQNPRNNIQTSHSPQHKRFAVIHDNGSVEYFDNLEIIIRKYPHVRMAENIRNLIPNLNPNTPLSKPLAHNSDSNANIKNNLPLGQHQNLPNKNVPPKTHTLKNTVKPKIETIIKKKDITVMNKSNDNSGTLQTTILPTKLDNKKSEHLKSLTKESMKPSNNTRIAPMNLQENKKENIVRNVTTAENSINIVPKQSSDVSSKNKTTPLDGNKQKPPIDVILNNDQTIPYQENKINVSPVISNNNNEHSENVTKLEKEDLHLNNSEEVISPIVVQSKTNNSTVHTQENKPEILKISSSNNGTVDKSNETQFNCTKQNRVKNKIKTQNLTVINQKDNKETDDDYDEDLVSLGEPLMWFSSTDPEFWKKLVSVDGNPNFIYIINVQSQPKIEKDRKTIIHANGTTVEEIKETIWDAGDDEPPKITKTIKVTPANDVLDGT
ncbi:PREDICTED: GATA zinc finger domain-containing protein 14-like isoform X2 [Papilio xuthus]|uniref:GATA zinc finger domain-containing protein 14-like isoform X2 n=1 Tax=Papilio xuthus TaxID=66420 RepID=A0AAJ6ZR99_PAPXU|nr:PREDICTED: GATA zinc finger domain-containing protein 14-like isoform X2 [Papilio xuthus]